MHNVFLLNFRGRMTAVSVTASVPLPNRGALIGKFHICVCTTPQLRRNGFGAGGLF